MEQKCQPPVEKWRLVFGRHTKMGSGGCDITQVEVGVRCLTKEFATALQQIINEYIKALWNYHGMLNPWSRTRKPLSRDSSLLSNFNVIQLWLHHKKDAKLLEFLILSVPPLSSYKQFTSKVLHWFVIIDCFLLSATTCQSLVEDKVNQYRENMKEWYWVGRMCWWTTLFTLDLSVFISWTASTCRCLDVTKTCKDHETWEAPAAEPWLSQLSPNLSRSARNVCQSLMA